MKLYPIACAAALLFSASTVTATDYPVIPAPVEYTAHTGQYLLPDVLTVAVSKGVEKNTADEIASYLTMRGIRNKVAKKGDLTLSTDKSIAPEGYLLNIDNKGIEIKASDNAGFFYAVQTLSQMIAKSDDRSLAACTINDYPRFEHRGLMLDPARWFIPKEEVLKMIDIAAAMKINRLHLHLADDNGWRIEIKQYPKLTEVGAWRVDRPEYFPGRINAVEGEPTPIGGFYTQDDMRQIVDYASERHITVIPEIDVPAHSAAAIASYPELACPITDKFVGVFPGIGGPDASIILCAGNENVYKFYQNVIDELIDIFPSEYFHLGGDEAEKSHWKKCPDCNRKMAEQGITDYESLQGYFMDRLSSYVRTKGRTPIGWDEVTHGNPKEEMVIMGWNGYGQAAVNYAKKTGSKFILTPAKVLYLLRYQGPQWFEPFTYFGNSTLEDVYTFEPVKADWTPELRNQFLGIQGSLWAEFINSPEDLEYLLFPRLLALADNAWRQEGSADWGSFLKALDDYLPELDRRNITFARSMFNLDHKSSPKDGALEVDITCIRPDVEIRYSDSDPTLAEYKTLTETLTVDSPCKIYATTFRNGIPEGKVLTLDFAFNEATGAKVDATACNNDLAYVLTNGLRGTEKSSDFEWAGWHNANAEFVIDLGKLKPVKNITLGTISNSHICVASPRKVSVYGSHDGTDYTLLSTVELPDEIVFHKGAKITDIDFGQLDGTETRYVKFVAENPGRIPDGYARATAPTWMYFDEVIIN